jgi:ADP-ribose pyrophosphatase
MDKKPVKRDFIHHGVVFDLFVDHIEYPSGGTDIREVAEHPGGSAIVPMLDDTTVLLIRQYRYPIGTVIYELPAGKLTEGENPEHCAHRELEEETGYSADVLTHMTSIYTTPGFCTEILHIFLAENLRPLDSGQRLEAGEDSITVHRMSLGQAIHLIESGEITDAKTIVGLFLAARKFNCL